MRLDCQFMNGPYLREAEHRYNTKMNTPRLEFAAEEMYPDVVSFIF